MGRKIITFRAQTVGNISDLIRDEGLVCHESESVLNFLAGELLRYQDEGRQLAPTIVFCIDAAALFAAFPGSVRHEIGKAPLAADSVKRVLKECAPLALGAWNIYIERVDSTECKYGVFSYIASPTTIPLHEAIGVAGATICLLMRKAGVSTIEVRGAKGNELALVFSTTREEESQVADPIVPFTRSCCAEIPSNALGEEFRIYFQRLIETGLNESHGAILACSKTKDLDQVADLHDGIIISPQLDFFGGFSAYRSDSSAESILRLRSSEELFSGILQSDGIVLFDASGSLIAYRVFYRPTVTSSTHAPVPAGGARRRAFEGLKSLVGTALSAVLFRSQDGLTIIHGGD